MRTDSQTCMPLYFFTERNGVPEFSKFSYHQFWGSTSVLFNLVSICETLFKSRFSLAIFSLLLVFKLSNTVVNLIKIGVFMIDRTHSRSGYFVALFDKL